MSRDESSFDSVPALRFNPYINTPNTDDSLALHAMWLSSRFRIPLLYQLEQGRSVLSSRKYSQTILPASSCPTLSRAASKTVSTASGLHAE